MDAEGEMQGNTGFSPRCLRWSDTIISTEGHPFIASALIEASENVFGEMSACEKRDEGCEEGGRERSNTASGGGGGNVFIFDRVMEMASLKRRGGQEKKDKVFEPRHYYALPVNSAGFKERPKQAEVEVKVSGATLVD